ncbi:Protein of unknown function (DUF1009) [Salipiger profundus]|uniref:LpxI C-terminal domain-containing protein n=1 Tax=Salipiger profundus TaxID=1229727 RepID=A0A1U7DA73_9RHOB|nr:Protein of unknown function (DUF1009) [Salipiger profundus]
MPPAGVLTATAPDPEVSDAARVGDEVSVSQAQADLGQACVIREGAVIAREDDAGTDAMIAGLPPGRAGSSTRPRSPDRSAAPICPPSGRAPRAESSKRGSTASCCRPTA